MMVFPWTMNVPVLDFFLRSAFALPLSSTIKFNSMPRELGDWHLLLWNQVRHLLL